METSRPIFSGKIVMTHRLGARTVLGVADATCEAFIGLDIVVGDARATVTGLDLRRNKPTVDGSPRLPMFAVEWASHEPDLSKLEGLTVREWPRPS
jgi:hypothetical protein